MNAQELIREVSNNASEYLEEVQDPSAFVAEILANKVIHLQKHILYLERRLDARSKIAM